MSETPRPLGLSLQVFRSGLPQGLGLDTLLLLAIVCIGFSVHRIAPDLLAAYIGVALLFIWWLLVRAAAAPPRRGGP